MMKRSAYLAKNIALFALNSVGSRIILFLLVPLYTIALTTSEYGLVDLVTTIATLLVPVMTMNIGEAIMRFSLDDENNESDIIRIGVLFVAFAAIVGTIVFALIRIFPQITVSGWIVYVFCVSQGIYITASCVLRGQEKLLQYAIGNIILTFLTAVFNIAFLLVFKWGVKGYFLAYTTAYVMAGLYCVVSGSVFATLKSFRINLSLMKKMVKYSVLLVPNSFMWWIMNSSDHIMVTAMIGATANGIYAVSYKLPSILSVLSVVFNQAWSYSAIHENRSEDRVAFNNRMYDKLVRFQSIVTVFLMCAMKPFMKIYVTPAYYEAWQYTPYLLAGSFFLTMGTFLSTSYTVNKDSKGFLYSGSFGALINVTLNWLLIPVIGVHGTAFATCISYISVFLYRVMDTRKYMKIDIFRPEYMDGYVILILTAASMFLAGWMGQAVLVAEFVAILLLNGRFMKECLEIGVGIVRKIRRR